MAGCALPTWLTRSVAFAHRMRSSPQPLTPAPCLPSQLTIFKRVCRKLGLQRWPYEKPCREGQQRTPTVQAQGGPLGSDGQQHWALQVRGRGACSASPAQSWSQTR